MSTKWRKYRFDVHVIFLYENIETYLFTHALHLVLTFTPPPLHHNGKVVSPKCLHVTRESQVKYDPYMTALASTN